MKKFCLALLAVTLGSATMLSQDRAADRQFLLDRAKSLELATPYVPPPGDALEHHTAGFAKIMCSAVFITGLAPDFAAENVGYFISRTPSAPRSASRLSTAPRRRCTSPCPTARAGPRDTSAIRDVSCYRRASRSRTSRRRPCRGAHGRTRRPGRQGTRLSAQCRLVLMSTN